MNLGVLVAIFICLFVAIYLPYVRRHDDDGGFALCECYRRSTMETGGQTERFLMFSFVS
jgi:hypothetical protein